MSVLLWPAPRHPTEEGPTLRMSITVHAYTVSPFIRTKAVAEGDVTTPSDDLCCYVSSRMCILQLANASASCLYSTIMKLDVYVVNASHLYLFIVA